MAALVRSMRPSPYDAQAIMMAAIYNGLALAAALRSMAVAARRYPVSKYSAGIRANPAPRRADRVTHALYGRHGTGVWPEFRERPRPARTSAPLTAGPGHRQERDRSLAGTYNLGGWFTAAVGPERARCRTCARKGPVSGRGGPGHWRPSRRRRWPGCVTYRCKVVSLGRLRRRGTGSGPCTRCTTTTGGRLVFHVFAAWPS
jgi:hypothetical protein